jgi:hypothetical protein
VADIEKLLKKAKIEIEPRKAAAGALSRYIKPKRQMAALFAPKPATEAVETSAVQPASQE